MAPVLPQVPAAAQDGMQSRHSVRAGGDGGTGTAARALLVDAVQPNRGLPTAPRFEAPRGVSDRSAE